MRRFIFFALAAATVLAVAAGIPGGAGGGAAAQAPSGQTRLTVFETFGSAT